MLLSIPMLGARCCSSLPYLHPPAIVLILECDSTRKEEATSQADSARKFSEITSASMMTCTIQARQGRPSTGKAARRAKSRLSRTESFKTWFPPEYLNTAMEQHRQVTSYRCQTLWVSYRPIW